MGFHAGQLTFPALGDKGIQPFQPKPQANE
jgi:hypothetical protein